MKIEKPEEHIASKEMGCEIYFSDEVTSTNTRAKELVRAGKPSWTLVTANYQSQGKGRRGKTWVAPKGKDIFMSLLLRPDIQATQASMLTLVMGLSVAQAVNDNLGVKNQIKWPNDVVVEGKKICGILTEMEAKNGSVNYVIIGAGINCNTKDFTEEGLQDATSLSLLTDKEINRGLLLAKVMEKFKGNFDKFMKTKDLSLLKDKYNQLLVNNDSEVMISGSDENWQGIAKGINERGELLVEDKDGEVHNIFSGEVSVRGIYGYV